MELTVLGCSGSYGAPAGGACSGYLVRTAGATLWLDCGNGTLANLQRHAAVDDVTAVIVTHWHPDHCVDLYGLHILLKYALGRQGLPVYAPEGTEARLGTLVDDDWGGVFAWNAVGDGATTTIAGCSLRFSRTDHPPPTMAVEIAADGKRLVYTADTGPAWSPEAFGPGADLVLSEATFQRHNELGRVHISARQAGEAARAAGARRLMLTHLWPGLDPTASVVEGSEAFGREVLLAAPHQRTRI
ncbi:MAG TPA: MBL fold metallo-hydrolase [Acidimicrobiia bacterium]